MTFPLYVEVDEIYNLACPASPIHYQHDPVQTTKTSVHGAINMLGLAKRLRLPHLPGLDQRGVRRPARASAAGGYWGNVNPIGPRSCYDEGKRCAETLFFDYYRQHGLEIQVARIFNTYGPRMHPNDGRVVSNFIVQALKNEPITIYGEGRQTRSFCYVDDLIEGFVRLMAVPGDFPGPVNLGNPGEFTIRELAEQVIALTGSRSKLEFRPLPADDPTQRQPDIALAREKLGWEPQVPLRDGLVRTIAYFDAAAERRRRRSCSIRRSRTAAEIPVSDPLTARLDELESRVAFQDDLLATLDRSVAGVDRELRALRLQLEEVRGALDAVRVAVAHDARDEPPPPHY